MTKAYRDHEKVPTALHTSCTNEYRKWSFKWNFTKLPSQGLQDTSQPPYNQWSLTASLTLWKHYAAKPNEMLLRLPPELFWPTGWLAMVLRQFSNQVTPRISRRTWPKKSSDHPKNYEFFPTNHLQTLGPVKLHYKPLVLLHSVYCSRSINEWKVYLDEFPGSSSRTRAGLVGINSYKLLIGRVKSIPLVYVYREFTTREVCSHQKYVADCPRKR